MSALAGTIEKQGPAGVCDWLYVNHLRNLTKYPCLDTCQDVLMEVGHVPMKKAPHLVLTYSF